MPTTVFIALQCCQCSTMQVKPQKKSSNKWTCVVCNQKQSVRKVFAQGHMAKDLRLFVQSFNISRESTDAIPFNKNIKDDDDDADTGFAQGSQRKRRQDWTQYLDLPDPNQKLKEEEGGEFEGRIVTKEMLKKPKSNKYGESDDEGEPYKPVFSKRNNINKHVFSQGDQKSVLKSTSSADEYDGKTKLKTYKASKWNDYMTKDDDGLLLGRLQNLGDERESCDTILDTDERVEDEAHPAFM